MVGQTIAMHDHDPMTRLRRRRSRTNPNISRHTAHTEEGKKFFSYRKALNKEKKKKTRPTVAARQLNLMLFLYFNMVNRRDITISGGAELENNTRP